MSAYEQQVAVVTDLSQRLVSTDPCSAEWDALLGEWTEADAKLALMNRVYPCWKCGGLTLPEPNGRGRWRAGQCTTRAEEVPHPADEEVFCYAA